MHKISTRFEYYKYSNIAYVKMAMRLWIIYSVVAPIEKNLGHLFFFSFQSYANHALVGVRAVFLLERLFGVIQMS